MIVVDTKVKRKTFFDIYTKCVRILMARPPPFCSHIEKIRYSIFFVCVCVLLLSLTSQATAMVMAGRSVHLTTLFHGQA